MIAFSLSLIGQLHRVALFVAVGTRLRDLAFACVARNLLFNYSRPASAMILRFRSTI